MPLYDFTCPRGHTFERMVPLAAFDEAQACECGEGARRLISAPRVLSDQIEAVRGADGKMHDSLSGLRASYLPSGNPQGERYLELGDQNITPTEHKVDRRQRRNDIKAAMEDVRNGRVAPIPPAPPGM